MMKWLFVLFPVLLLGAYSCDNTTGIPADSGEGDSDTPFKLETLLSPSDGGSISPSTGQFEEGSTIELTAEAEEGYLFVRWEGDLSGINNPDSLEFDSDKTVIATFEKKEYTLNMEIKGEGVVKEEIIESPAKTNYEHGSKVQLTADPFDGWKFVQWEGDLEGGENPITIDIEEEASVTAIFKQVEEDENGSDENDDNGNSDNSGEEKNGDDKSGDDDKKDDDKDGKNGNSGDDKDDSKDDAPKHFTLDRNIKGSGTVWWEPHSETDKIPEGTKLTIGANPASGWEFSHWEGDFQGSENPIKGAKIYRDKSFRAIFERKEEEPDDPEPEPETTFTIIVEDMSDGEVKLTPDKEEYEEGEEVTAELISDEERVFEMWLGDLVDYGDENPVTFTIEHDMRINARILIKRYNVNIVEPSRGGALIFGTDQNFGYTRGQEIPITTSPNEGYRFVEWSHDLSEYGSENRITVPFDPDEVWGAVFEEEETYYSINIDLGKARNTGRIQINGEEYHPYSNDFEYEEGTVVEIHAFSAPGKHNLHYIFHHWEGGINSEENPVMLTLDSDVTLYPVFGAYTNIQTQTRNVDGDHGVGGEVVIRTPPEREGLYEVGQEIEAEAVPDDGWEFVEWDLSFSGSANPSIQDAGTTPGEAVFRKIESDPLADN